MKCQKCGTINEELAKFCRECGAELVGMNVMDEYPALKLMPTSLAKPKPLRRYTFWGYLFTLIWLCTCVCVIGQCVEEIWRYNGGKEVFLITALSFVISGILAAIFRAKRNVKLPKEIEYVSLNPKMRSFPFIVANNKIGVFDMKRKSITIPCDYESLEWIIPGKVLKAVHPEKGVVRIDIHNNELR